MLARVATEAVTSYVRPKSARNPGGYESPRRPESRPSSARAPRGEASAFQAASTFHPGFTKAGREFAVPYGFWDRPESRPSSARAPRAFPGDFLSSSPPQTAWERQQARRAHWYGPRRE